MFKRWNHICFWSEEALFPAGAEDIAEPFAPLVLLVRRDGLTNRGIWAISSLEEAGEVEGVRCLTPCYAAEPQNTR